MTTDRPRVAAYGFFGMGNIGNEGSLAAFIGDDIGMLRDAAAKMCLQVNADYLIMVDDDTYPPRHALLSLFTGRNMWFSGARMLVLGAIAGAVTYGVGHLFGVGIG